MRVNENKTDLFRYFAQRVTEKMIDLQGKIFVTTFDETILAVPHSKDITSISPCTQEEADTRILLHVEDCAKEGHKKILIRTTDTDVLILAILCYQMADVKELWVGFGVGKHFKYIAAHEIATKLGTISVPCLYWIRCHIILFRQRKDYSLEHLGSISRGC